MSKYNWERLKVELISFNQIFKYLTPDIFLMSFVKSQS